MDAIYQELYTLVHTAALWLFAFAALCFVISVLFAGLRRMPIFGTSDRAMLLSNAAFYAAITGFIMILLAVPVAVALSTVFPTHPPLIPPAAPTTVPTGTPTSGSTVGF